MRNTAVRTVLFLAIVAPLAACDAPADHSDDINFRGLPSTLWTDGDQGCDAVYVKTEGGTICAPSHFDNVACKAHKQFDMCGHPVGYPAVGPWLGGSCAHPCFTAADCAEGMVCSPYHNACLWENPYSSNIIWTVEVGTWGVCDANGTCDGECVNTNAGQICVQSCESADDCTAIGNECSENAPVACMGNVCRIPCDQYGGCHGINDMACDVQTQQCVRPNEILPW